MAGDQDSHSQQLDEIIAEYLQSVEAGQAPDRDEMLLKHPELADQLKEFFDQQDN